MNSENSKTSEPHVLILKLTDKLVLRWGEKNVALSNISIYYIRKYIQSSCTNKFNNNNNNNNNNNISAPTWNDEFELPDGSYSMSDIQDHFEYIFKKHRENIDNPSVRTYVNKIENRTTFKMKTGYYLKLLISKTMKLLGSTDNKITKGKNGENVPHFEITEVVLVHCNTANNDYQ